MFINQSGFVVINAVLFVIALFLLIPIAVLFIECMAALLPSRSQVGNVSVARPKVSVLIPAHNEALCIGKTLSTLMQELTDQDCVVVIADNCTDETAAIARKFRATVLERIEPNRRGKGFALDYGIKFIKANPPEVVVIIDADCTVHQGTIDRLARMAVALKQPVQSTNLLAPPAKLTPKDTVSSLAFTVKNLVRQRGLKRLGLPGLLTGTGMAFPWSLIGEASLASDNIVEDKQLGLELTLAGHPPAFCEEALVTGCLPQEEQAAKTQRTRWAHGHLQTLLTQIPLLLRAFVGQRRFDLLAVALDLSVPPLSLLIMMWMVVMGGALLSAALGASWTPGIFLAIQGLLIFIAIIGAWARFGRTDIPLHTLLSVPFYIFWKMPIYWSFLVRPQKAWIRTERDT
ncbi:MAG TPA: glycosyltransferase family 2 protein [Chroococcales cyanobacterium]|jgi:cellulose synthase/poly-beta-1,6-N-acetylglucosamine synthase-like glycosyltransferase